jgi:hypothetical protein
MTTTPPMANDFQPPTALRKTTEQGRGTCATHRCAHTQPATSPTEGLRRRCTTQPRPGDFAPRARNEVCGNVRGPVRVRLHSPAPTGVPTHARSWPSTTPPRQQRRRPGIQQERRKSRDPHKGRGCATRRNPRLAFPISRSGWGGGQILVALLPTPRHAPASRHKRSDTPPVEATSICMRNPLGRQEESGIAGGKESRGRAVGFPHPAPLAQFFCIILIYYCNTVITKIHVF